MLFNDIVYSR